MRSPGELGRGAAKRLVEALKAWQVGKISALTIRVKAIDEVKTGGARFVEGKSHPKTTERADPKPDPRSPR